MGELEEQYERRLPALERAASHLRFLLHVIIEQIEDRRLVRAGPIDVRIKQLSSLTRKVGRNAWTADQAMTQTPDLVGGRIVVNNIVDVYRVEALLRESLSIETDPIGRQDYIAVPQDHGYRALHLNFRVNVPEMFGYDFVPCEVQIRTRLQHSWAVLSHADIYKQEDLPQDLHERFADLATTLEAADRIAGEIRDRVQQARTPSQEQPCPDRISADGIAHVFQGAFGRALPDYVITESVRLCADLGLEDLEPLAGALTSQVLRDKLDAVYSEKLPIHIDHETFLVAVFYWLAGGEQQAINYVRAKAQREFDEVDAIARREILAELPGTVDELIVDLESWSSEDRTRLFAQALDIKDECARCHAEIIDPYNFAEAAIDHYGLADPEASEAADRIQSAILGSGVDAGGGLSGYNLCSHCAAYMMKH
ncbi:MAG: hypothetical protein RIE24_21155 [Silicimonas sp.]|jgi:ppGpp synthetase/RelA/SpoT-type nucleotidyltranferase|uniref:GTP pyrophosphokinase n=1 Tax=Roseitalea porphyridii TaxID=1852022 RepID=UPI0032EDFEE9